VRSRGPEVSAELGEIPRGLRPRAPRARSATAKYGPGRAAGIRSPVLVGASRLRTPLDGDRTREPGLLRPLVRMSGRRHADQCRLELVLAWRRGDLV
jgi:hypothetical protein